jgi:hypothetical protein
MCRNACEYRVVFLYFDLWRQKNVAPVLHVWGHNLRLSIVWPEFIFS